MRYQGQMNYFLLEVLIVSLPSYVNFQVRPVNSDVTFRVSCKYICVFVLIILVFNSMFLCNEPHQSIRLGRQIYLGVKRILIVGECPMYLVGQMV